MARHTYLAFMERSEGVWRLDFDMMMSFDLRGWHGA